MGRIPDFQWFVIGGGPDRAELEQLINDNGLENTFKLLGSRSESDVQKAMQTADLYVMSSIMLKNRRMEGIPVALMESLAVELPSIATRISGIPELVEDQVTGRLVPERDSEALADAIVELWQNPDKGLQLAKAGRERVIAEFGIVGNTEKLHRLFQTILTEPAD
jgi:colanic acid/amylovoran biosynthesis glycosyltransferase